MPISTIRGQYRSLTHKSHSQWQEINTKIPCPIDFTDEEINAQLLDDEGWNENADLFDSLDGFVHRDGWTSNADCERAFEMFAQLRKQALQSLSGEELVDFKTRWAVIEHEPTWK
jgi:hypothetical protein